jgi:Mn2+/Fe2+ NRAMP family transporter
MCSAIVVMFAIMVAAGSTLHPEGITTIQTADEAARALRPIAGDLAGLLFTLGIVGTGALAVPVLAGSTAYALSEAFALREGLGRSFRDARGFYGILIAATGFAAVLNFAGLNPVRFLYFAAILNGLAAPPLILLMLLLSNSRSLMARWRGRRLSNALMISALLCMTGLPIAYVLVGAG